jgi:hypothetical protein
MPTNVSHGEERAPQPIVPIYLELGEARLKSRRSTSVAGAFNRVSARPFLLLEQGAKRQGNLPMLITLRAGQKRAGVSQGVAPVLDEFGSCCRANGQAPVYEQQTAWQPPISNLSHRDASDRPSLPFPVSESWSELLSFEHLM